MARTQFHLKPQHISIFAASLLGAIQQRPIPQIAIYSWMIAPWPTLSNCSIDQQVNGLFVQLQRWDAVSTH